MRLAARLGAALVGMGGAALLVAGPSLAADGPGDGARPGTGAGATTMTARPSPDAGPDLTLPVAGGGAVLAGGTWLLLVVRRAGQREE